MTSETIIPDVISENEPFTKILSIRVDVESDIRVGFLVRGINDLDSMEFKKSWQGRLSYDSRDLVEIAHDKTSLIVKISVRKKTMNMFAKINSICIRRSINFPNNNISFVRCFDFNKNTLERF